MADVSNAVETIQLSASESANDVDTDITGPDQHSAHVAETSPDANGKRNPVRHRVFKTVCLYASFAALVRYLECIRAYALRVRA